MQLELAALLWLPHLPLPLPLAHLQKPLPGSCSPPRRHCRLQSCCREGWRCYSQDLKRGFVGVLPKLHLAVADAAVLLLQACLAQRLGWDAESAAAAPCKDLPQQRPCAWQGPLLTRRPCLLLLMLLLLLLVQLLLRQKVAAVHRLAALTPAHSLRAAEPQPCSAGKRQPGQH